MSRPGRGGGETHLANLVLLCRHHQRRVQEDDWTVEMGEAGARASQRPGPGAFPNR